MNKAFFRIAADVPQNVRELLLLRFPPQFKTVYARSVTWAYRVTEDFTFNPNQQIATVYGIHRADRHEAFLVRLGEEEWQAVETRLLHLTLSTAPGTPPADANQIEMKHVLRLPQPITFKTNLARFPLWNLAAGRTQRASVAA